MSRPVSGIILHHSQHEHRKWTILPGLVSNYDVSSAIFYSTCFMYTLVFGILKMLAFLSWVHSKDLFNILIEYPPANSSHTGVELIVTQRGRSSQHTLVPWFSVSPLRAMPLSKASVSLTETFSITPLVHYKHKEKYVKVFADMSLLATASPLHL